MDVDESMNGTPTNDPAPQGDESGGNPWDGLMTNPDTASALRAYAEHRARGQGKVIKETQEKLSALEKERKQEQEQAKQRRKQEQEQAERAQLEKEGELKTLAERDRAARESAETEAQRLRAELEQITESLETEVAASVKALPAALRKEYEDFAATGLTLTQRRMYLRQLEQRVDQVPKRNVRGVAGRTTDPVDAMSAATEKGASWVLGNRGSK